MKKYYTLVARSKTVEQDSWSPQFGDYDREVVQDEMDEYKDSYSWDGFKFKIITTAPDQASINAAIAELNRTGGK